MDSDDVPAMPTIVKVMLAIAAFMVLAAAFGDKGGDTAGQPQPAAPAKAKTIHISDWDNQSQESLRICVSTFDGSGMQDISCWNADAKDDCCFGASGIEVECNASTKTFAIALFSVEGDYIRERNLSDPTCGGGHAFKVIVTASLAIDMKRQW